ncbi:Holliday junction branch migration protein RuvA [Camelimonas abortus]|uniref:Holliday junction branch migration complex subunit RuvA n=1 Tax=Camelimonas abortus TaxID=1017184 RepID=A0ABV7LED4_9HYPH
MIGRLKGVVDSVGEDYAIIDVHGVGYMVHCSTRTLQNLPRAGEAVALSIETHVREDMIRLYGFRTDAEREWFRLLQNVQGVGARVALGVLSALDPAALAAAIAMGDRAAVGRAPGVGPKLAARIISELKDKAPAFGHTDMAAARLAAPPAGAGEGGAAADAVSALVNLGYGQPQAAGAVAAAMREAGEDADARTLIRLGLKQLAKGA